MRKPIIAAVCLLAACSGGEPEQKQAAAAAEQLDAGHWEISTEVTSISPTDKAPPKIDTPAGTKATVNGCIAEAERKKPQPALLAGTEDECTYKSFYMSGGRINASMSCERKGLPGELMMTVEGSYTGTTIEGTVGMDTYLAGDGDVKISSKLSGRRIAASCPAPEAEGTNSQ